jgi:hypothetical protein
MDRFKTARNLGILLVIGAAVYFIPGGGRAASTFESVLLVAFAFGIGYLGLRLYREQRIAVHGLGDRLRALFYGSLALGTFAIIAQQRMFRTGLGELVWFVMVGLVVYALIVVYRRWRAY